MSAVFGFLRLDETTAGNAAIAAMGKALAHRGPDGVNSLAVDSVALGHCLLRVNREDRFESQPLHDRAMGVTLIADLRLDNREALAEALGIAPPQLATMADSAVLLEAWRKWGEGCVDRLIGDFTFAAWDHRERRLYLARDHMGQRGLFIHRGERMIAFATEVKALWQLPEVPRRLNPVGIARRLLRALEPEPATTLYEGIEILPAGTIRWFGSNGSSGERRYWRPRPAARHQGRDPAYYVAAYREAVEEAIACRVRRLERPPVLMFSGGFDSGIIAVCAARLLGQSGSKLIGLCSVMPVEDSTTPRNARAMAQNYAGLPGFDLRFYTRGDEHMLDALEETFQRNDDCAFLDLGLRAAFRLAESEGARLVMDGHGGDYTVNHRSPLMLGRILLRGHLRRFVREWRARAAFTGWSMPVTFRQDVLPVILPEWLRRAYHRLLRGGGAVWRQTMVNRQLASDLFAAGAIDPDRLRNPDRPHLRWSDRCTFLLESFQDRPAVHTALAGSHRTDLSRPFHDPRVVELGLAIPEELQFRNGCERWLARTVFGGDLPEALLRRARGNDLVVPDMVAMARAAGRAELAARGDRLQHGRSADFIDYDRVKKVLLRDTADEGRAGHWTLPAATSLALGRFVEWFERTNR